MKKFLGALSLLMVLCLIAGIPMIPAAQAAGAYWIGVDITNQITTVYRTSDDSVVRHMLCSTGLDATPTPTGTFYMPKKVYSTERTEWYYFPEFDCYAKYASRIKGGILFHSVIYGSKSNSSLRQSSVRNLGKKASHGCIRLTVDNAKWIAQNCPAGTKVKIYHGTYNPDLRQQLTGRYQTLQLGNSGTSVRKLQIRLWECGWYDGSVSGKFDAATQTAVRAFQKASGLTADGKAGSKTQTALYAASPKLGLYATLKKGDRSLAVEQLQRMLAQIGLFTGAVDGSFGVATEQAVRDYQAARNMTVNGIATPALQAKLASESGIVPTPAPTATPEPLPVFIGTATVKTKGSTLALRATASSSGKVLARMANGTQVNVIENGDTWVKVWHNGIAGYAMKSYLTLNLADFSTPTPIPTATAPATDAPTASPEATAPSEPTAAPTEMPVPTPTPTPTPTPAPTQAPIGTATVKTNGGSLAMRQSASTGSAVVIKLKNRTQVDLLEDLGTWLKVRYNGKTGYIMAKYATLRLNDGTTPAPTVQPTIAPTIGTAKVATNGGSLTMRKSMSTSSSSLAKIPNKTTLPVLSVQGNWVQVTYKGKTGYVSKAYVVLTLNDGTTPAPTAAPSQNPTAAPTPTVAPIGTGTIRTNGGTLNLRASASTSARVVTRLKNGAKVEILQDLGTWLQVRSSGKTGYVMAKYVSVSGIQTPTPAPTAAPTPAPTTVAPTLPPWTQTPTTAAPTTAAPTLPAWSTATPEA